MEKSLNYHDLAENDYEFLSYDYEHGRVGNILCSSAQNICERYLKHVIDSECKDMDTSAALHSHSLEYLRIFLILSAIGVKLRQLMVIILQPDILGMMLFL